MLILLGGNRCRDKDNCKHFAGYAIIHKKDIQDIVLFKEKNLFAANIETYQKNKIFTFFDHEEDAREFLLEVLNAMSPNEVQNKLLQQAYVICGSSRDRFNKNSHTDSNKNEDWNSILVKDLMKEMGINN